MSGHYTPPAGDAVPLDFVDGPYTPPAGNAVPLEFRRGVVVGEDQYAFPSSWTSSAVATPLLTGERITPPGWQSSAFSAPSVVNAARALYPGGIAPLPQTGTPSQREVPPPWISLWTRTLNLNSPSRGIAPPAFPTAHVVAFEIQYVDLAGRSITPMVFGTPRVESSVRYITPPFISSNIFGSHLIARIQVLEPSGWESSVISDDHQLDINLQRLYHHSGVADPAGYGDTHVRNEFELIAPLGWVSAQYNSPTVFNYTQVVLVSPYMDTTGDPTQWPSFYPFVENQHRFLHPSGWVSSRYPLLGTYIANTAEPIVPPGLDATLWGPDTFIAYHTREVSPQSWTEFYSSHYTIVYNGAKVLAPQGWSSSAVGRPDPVLNLNRTVKQIFPHSGETFGIAFIADAVRTIYPSLFYKTPSGFPEVRFNPHPIAPTSALPPQFGAPTVFEHFNILYPLSTNVFPYPRVGEPFITNRNKTLHVYPSDQSSYGLAVVSNYDTHTQASGADTSIWGSHLIMFRTRTVAANTISLPVFSVAHQIRNVLPDPPSQQLVTPPSFYIGSDHNPGIVPAPALRDNTLYPLGVTDTRYGQATVRTNTITPPNWPFNLDQFGTPLLSAVQYVFPNTVPWPNTDPPVSSSDQNWEWGSRPRVSPHTIYAPSSDQATQQARLNHPSAQPRVIDYNLSITAGQWSRDGGWPFFGRPDISNWFRTIGPVPNHSGWVNRGAFGVPEVILGRRYIYPTPITSLRMGIVSLWGVTQYVNFDLFNDGVPPYNVFGDHVVAFPPPPPGASPDGFVSSAWGSHRVELFHREVAPPGIPHRGNPQQGLTNPWGVPLVGFPREYVWGGYDFSLWGNTWVSHYTRECPVEGWNSLTLEDDDIGSFHDRMRVYRRNPPGGIAGIPSSFEAGTHLVTHFNRSVLARGISSYNGGNHVVKAIATLFPEGWDSLVIGDIDEWEAGKIKPYGDDLSLLGTPRMCWVVRPSGETSGNVGDARVAQPIYVAGIPEIGFDGPSVSDPYGCTNRVVTPLPIISQQVVPEPMVTE